MPRVIRFDLGLHCSQRSTTSQRTHDVNITSPQRRCNVMTLHRRWGDVIFTSCACRDVPIEGYTYCIFMIDSGMPCEENMEYKSCGPSSVMTCANVLSSTVPDATSKACEDGCFCKEGFVMDVDKCVSEIDCGCMYNGQYYPVSPIYPLCWNLVLRQN